MDKIEYKSSDGSRKSMEAGTERIIYNVLSCIEGMIFDITITPNFLPKLTDKLSYWLSEYCKSQVQLIEEKTDSKKDKRGDFNFHDLSDTMNPENNIRYIINSILSLYPFKKKLLEMLDMNMLKDFLSKEIELIWKHKVEPVIRQTNTVD